MLLALLLMLGGFGFQKCQQRGFGRRLNSAETRVTGRRCTGFNLPRRRILPRFPRLIHFVSLYGSIARILRVGLWQASVGRWYDLDRICDACVHIYMEQPAVYRWRFARPAVGVHANVKNGGSRKLLASIKSSLQRCPVFEPCASFITASFRNRLRASSTAASLLIAESSATSAVVWISSAARACLTTPLLHSNWQRQQVVKHTQASSQRHSK